MYYYIFEQTKTYSERNQQNRIKDIIGMLGIAGEITTVSPARTIEELANMGMAKGYSTIIAVGSDKLINKVASLIQGTDFVLGIVPINASDFIHELIRTYDIKEACESLRFRYVQNRDIAMIEPNKYFLTEATIFSPKPMLAKIDLDQASLQATFTKMAISRDLHLAIEDKSKSPGSVIRSLYWFLGKKTKDIHPSVFSSKRIKIDTSQPAPLIVSDEILAKTPLVAKLKPKALKLITVRGKMEGK